jgi:hypothetical protein
MLRLRRVETGPIYSHASSELSTQPEPGYRRNCVKIDLGGLWRGFSFLAVFFVWDQVAGEDFDYSFAGSDHWCHIKSHVNCAGNQPLLFDFVPSESEGEDRADYWDRFDHSLGEAPPANPDNSSRHAASHLNFNQSTSPLVLPTFRTAVVWHSFVKDEPNASQICLVGDSC